MATVEALRVEIQQTLAKGELEFEEFKQTVTLQLSTLDDKQTALDGFERFNWKNEWF